MSKLNFRTVQRATALTALSVLMACAPGSGPSSILPTFTDQRPEGRRYVDYLSLDGGMTEIALDIEKRKLDGAGGRRLTFTSDTQYDPSNAPVLSRTQVVKEMERLKTCLLDAWPGPKPDVNVIIKSGLPPQAEALPNQISLNIGLIAAPNISGGEIAFIMAHELSHVLLDHYSRSEFNKQQAEVLGKVADAAVLAAYMSEMRGKRSGNSITFFLEDESDAHTAAAYAVAAYGASQFVVDGLIESSWSRAQEYESDRLALDLLENAGLTSDFSYQALRRIETFQNDQKTRLQQFDQIAEARMNKAAESKDPNLIITTGIGVFTSAVSQAALDLWDLLDRSHPSPAARVSEVDGYLGEFDEADPVEPTVTCDLKRVERAVKRNDVRNTYNALQSSFEVDGLIMREDYAGARSAAQKGLRAGLERHPVTRMAAYRADNASGRHKQALGHLQSIRLNADTPLSVYTLLVTEYIARNRMQPALETIIKAEQYYLKDYFYPARIQIASARENLPEVIALKARCEASIIDKIKSACTNILSTRKAAAVEGDGSTGSAVGNALDSFFGGLENLTLPSE